MPTIQELARQTKQSPLAVAKAAKEQGFSGGVNENLPPEIVQAISSKAKALAPTTSECQSEMVSQAQSNNEVNEKTTDSTAGLNPEDITDAVNAFENAAVMRTESIDELKRIIAEQRGRLQAFTLHQVQETAYHDTKALLEEEAYDACLRSYHAEKERYQELSKASREVLALRLQSTEGNCQKRRGLATQIQGEMNQLSLSWQNSKHASFN